MKDGKGHWFGNWPFHTIHAYVAHEPHPAAILWIQGWLWWGGSGADADDSGGGLANTLCTA